MVMGRLEKNLIFGLGSLAGNGLEKVLKGVKSASRKIIPLALAGTLIFSSLGCGYRNANVTTLNYPRAKTEYQQKQNQYSNQSLEETLKSALLKQVDITKTTTKPPTGQANKIDDLGFSYLGNNRYALKWGYKNVGDYNQDGIVDVKDVTPLAAHFQEEASANERKWIDGNEDGIIDIKDITPLAANFGTDCAGYYIYGTPNFPEQSFSKIGEIDFSDGFSKPKKFQIELPIEEIGKTYHYFTVAPFDNDGGVGEQSNVVELPNLFPIAKLSAEPVEGEPPLTVEFDASANDPDGTIEKYEWDFDGDGVYDDITTKETDPDTYDSNSYTYETFGPYNAKVRVTDNDNAKTIANITINVINYPPIAKLSANPIRGAIPLTVDFDASDSFDQSPDGNIIKYEWDFDGDGEYDLDSEFPNAQHTYDSFGIYNTVVKVTDDDGASDTASVKITVPGWAHTWGGDKSQEYEPPYTDIENDEANGLSVDNDGNVYVMGYTNNLGSAGRKDIFLLKYNQAGEILWQKTWGDIVGAEGITTDSLGNVYLTGATSSFSEVGLASFLLKYSPNGDILWQKIWDSDADERFFSHAKAITTDSLDNIYVGGKILSWGGTNNDIFLLKYNQAGEILWQKTWSTNEDEDIYTLATDSNQNIYAAGYIGDPRYEKGDALIVKFLPDGKPDWHRRWGGIYNDKIYDLFIDSSDEIYATGYTRGFGNYSEALLLKYNSIGALKWQKIWGGIGNDIGNALAKDSSGSIYIAGKTTSFSAYSDVLFLKYSPTGELIFSKTWGGDMDDFAKGIGFDNNGNVYLTGSAPNAYGQGKNVVGDINSVNGSIFDPTVGDEHSINGKETIPNGYQGEPDPKKEIIDKGGGGRDMLIIKYGQSSS